MTGTRVSSGRQMSLDLDNGACTEVFQIDESGQHGEVFTRRWVVGMADRSMKPALRCAPSTFFR